MLGPRARDAEPAEQDQPALGVGAQLAQRVDGLSWGIELAFDEVRARVTGRHIALVEADGTGLGARDRARPRIDDQLEAVAAMDVGIAQGVVGSIAVLA